MKRRSWADAAEALTTADERDGLSPEDLELLAQASWWSGRPDHAVLAWERAFTGHLSAGEKSAAAAVALRLADHALRRLAFSVANGWLSRADKLLTDEHESEVHAWLKLGNAQRAFFADHDIETTIALIDEALEIARRQENADAWSMALGVKGATLVDTGRWAEGLELLDEATAAAISGELQPQNASDLYCITIGVCSNLGEYRRAGEWTDQADRWMERNDIRGYRGVCRVHRAELQRLRGSWTEAEQEARRACVELEEFRLLQDAGFANYQIGEVRLHMGDLEAAEEAFNRAFELGYDPQPGGALLLLARGEVDDAARVIAAAVSPDNTDSGHGLLREAQLLPAQVEIALAADDLETAQTATERLEEIAATYESNSLHAAAWTARGAVELSQDEPLAAARSLDKAWRQWQQIDLPFESARSRELLGRARAAAGDGTTAKLELRAARSVYQRLGAALDLARINDRLGEEPSLEGGDRVIKTFMFTDIVSSTDLVSLIGDDAWEELLHWHDRQLRAALADHGGEEVRHTGDGFLMTFERPADAVECAVAIQRNLAKHRREHGFAPWVRIGMHVAAATRQGTDYAGQGVHVAARVSDLADREEIVITSAVAEGAGTMRFQVSEPRAVTLKGIGDPVMIHTVQWR